MLSNSSEEYSGFNAVALCAIQLISSGFLFARILFYNEALGLFGGELTYVKETGVLGCFQSPVPAAFDGYRASWEESQNWVYGACFISAVMVGYYSVIILWLLCANQRKQIVLVDE